MACCFNFLSSPLRSFLKRSIFELRVNFALFPHSPPKQALKSCTPGPILKPVLKRWAYSARHIVRLSIDVFAIVCFVEVVLYVVPSVRVRTSIALKLMCFFLVLQTENMWTPVPWRAWNRGWIFGIWRCVTSKPCAEVVSFCFFFRRSMLQDWSRRL